MKKNLEKLLKEIETLGLSKKYVVQNDLNESRWGCIDTSGGYYDSGDYIELSVHKLFDSESDALENIDRIIESEIEKEYKKDQIEENYDIYYDQKREHYWIIPVHKVIDNQLDSLEGAYNSDIKHFCDVLEMFIHNYTNRKNK